MESLKIKPRALSKISLIINKMGISSLIMQLDVETGDEKQDRKELVKQLVALVIDNFYKAEEEMIELIAMLKDITKQEAEEVDIVSFIKELVNNDKIKDFLKLT